MLFSFYTWSASVARYHMTTRVADPQYQCRSTQNPLELEDTKSRDYCSSPNASAPNYTTVIKAINSVAVSQSREVRGAIMACSWFALWSRLLISRSPEGESLRQRIIAVEKRVLYAKPTGIDPLALEWELNHICLILADFALTLNIDVLHNADHRR